MQTACLKLFASQLHAARKQGASASPLWVLGGHEFSRVWLQGVVVSASEGAGLLDDGSGIVHLDTQAIDKQTVKLGAGEKLAEGRYIMVVGVLVGAASGKRTVKVHKMVGLGAEREALWNLEVVEMHRSVLKTTGGEGGW
mmetsp:Transcript_64764/g.204499  ORF Transcript_64764/g.204499 Transcript_64764/m.204499 type:complete len:140 (-) Transcript_64764:686-1105(-)